MLRLMIFSFHRERKWNKNNSTSWISCEWNVDLTRSSVTFWGTNNKRDEVTIQQKHETKSIRKEFGHLRSWKCEIRQRFRTTKSEKSTVVFFFDRTDDHQTKTLHFGSVVFSIFRFVIVVEINNWATNRNFSKSRNCRWATELWTSKWTNQAQCWF